MNDELKSKLNELGVTEEETLKKLEELGVETPEDLSMLGEDDFVKAGVKLVKARKLVNALRPEEPAEKPVIKTQAPQYAMSLDSVLPSVPSEDAWLSSFKVGGILKVQKEDYISAIRAALAGKIGVYDIPKALVAKLEEFANQNDEPVGEDFYALNKMLTRRSYAEIFAAIPGVDGTFVTEKRKTALTRKINETLWPALADSYSQLTNWMQMWTTTANVGGSGALAAAVLGQQVPPGMMAPPDASFLRDVADDVRSAINKSLSGTGKVVAAAMAYDYVQLKKVLDDPTLPMKIGMANREQMFKALGISVDSSLIRSETSIVRYALGFASFDETVAANTETGYLSALYTLGSQINWAQLGFGNVMPTVNGRASGVRRLNGDVL